VADAAAARATWLLLAATEAELAGGNGGAAQVGPLPCTGPRVALKRWANSPGCDPPAEAALAEAALAEAARLAHGERRRQDGQGD